MLNKLFVTTVKSINVYVLFLLVGVLFLCINNYTTTKVLSINSLTGTWYYAEDTTMAKMIITDKHYCKFYEEGSFKEIDTVIVSTLSPQCGAIVPVDQYSTYLQFKNLKDGSAECYLINTLTAKRLSISLIGSARRTDYVKY